MTRDRVGRFLSRLSIALSVIFSLVFVVQFDICCAITAFPLWSWAIPGLLLAAAGWWEGSRRHALLAAIFWILGVLFICEEGRSLCRGIFVNWPNSSFHGRRQKGMGLRIVSVNCSGGHLDAAREAAAYEPDILLLQESPTEDKLLRFEFWSPAAWKDYMSIRNMHRTEVGNLLHLLDDVPSNRPVIMGGDFNAPAYDRAFRMLNPVLRDAFREGGVGWGNSVMNEFVVQRYDQIWISRHFRAQTVMAKKTRSSDHRLVVADLVLNDR